MKRFLILALVASFVLAAGVASAKEVTMQGQFEMSWTWNDNTDFMETEESGASEDDFTAKQRIRQYFHYVDSENLSGTIGFEFDSVWGNTTGAPWTDDQNFELKHGFIDFNWPGTALNIRTGLQPLTFPNAVAGSPIWDDDVAGIIASYGINDNISVVAGWARLLDTTQNNDAGTDTVHDEFDVFTVILPITMDGWGLTPYVIYGQQGQGAGNAVSGLSGINATALQDDLDVWWAGGAFTLSAFDPFNFAADLIYGSVDGGSNGTNNDREGWFFTAIGTYTMDMVTPGIFFAYGTGEDDDPNNGSEAFPMLGSCYGPTSFGFDGSNLAWTGTDHLVDGGGDELSAMVIGGGLYGFSFLENVSHDLIVAYGVGTNDSDLTKNYEGNLGTRGFLSNGVLFNDKDSFWEVDFNTKYSLYEALTAYIEIGYISPDLDDDTHPAVDVEKLEDAWKLTVALKYMY